MSPVNYTREGSIVARTFAQATEAERALGMPEGMVEHVTLESPRTVSDTMRLRIATARDLGKSWPVREPEPPAPAMDCDTVEWPSVSK